MRRSKAFTLIELLIVVAIIAILAAIAVPNFIEAQTRAKVSRVKSDFRTFATALEAYRVDYNKYAINTDANVYGDNTRLVSLFAEIELIPLSTPVAYLTSVSLSDPFEAENRAGGAGLNNEFSDTYKYGNYRWTANWAEVPPSANDPILTMGDDERTTFLRSYDAAMLYSLGPAAVRTRPFVALRDYKNNNLQRALDRIYDPTNGTVSEGSITRWLGDTEGFKAPD